MGNKAITVGLELRVRSRSNQSINQSIDDYISQQNQ